MSALRYLDPFVSSSTMTQIDMFPDSDNINLILFINIVNFMSFIASIALI